jgi:hypothetical protein
VGLSYENIEYCDQHNSFKILKKDELTREMSKKKILSRF